MHDLSILTVTIRPFGRVDEYSDLVLKTNYERERERESAIESFNLEGCR